MDDLYGTVNLTQVANGEIVVATVVKLSRDLAKKKIDGNWWNLPGVSSQQRKQQNDHSWQWAKAIGELRNDRWHEALAVQTDNGDVQGAMLHRFDTFSFVDQGVNAVYIEALATAPRNRPGIVSNPEYRGVGECLLLKAIVHSQLLGFDGRVNLLAFNDNATIRFYENRGFAQVGYDDDLPQLELFPEKALERLREEGFNL